MGGISFVMVFLLLCSMLSAGILPVVASPILESNSDVTLSPIAQPNDLNFPIEEFFGNGTPYFDGSLEARVCKTITTHIFFSKLTKGNHRTPRGPLFAILKAFLQHCKPQQQITLTG